MVDGNDMVPWVGYQARRQYQSEDIDLPVTGEDHSWDVIGPDEFKVIEILEKRLVQLPGLGLIAPWYKLFIRYGDGHTEEMWKLPIEIRSPDLFREFEAQHADDTYKVEKLRQVSNPARREASQRKPTRG